MSVETAQNNIERLDLDRPETPKASTPRIYPELAQGIILAHLHITSSKLRGFVSLTRTQSYFRHAGTADMVYCAVLAYMSRGEGLAAALGTRTPAHRQSCWCVVPSISCTRNTCRGSARFDRTPDPFLTSRYIAQILPMELED
jgi:hypothetical protein